MDRDRYGSPLMSRQKSNASSSSGESPVHPSAARRTRPAPSGVGSSRAPNYTAQAAAQRLAQAMARSNDDDEDDESGFSFQNDEPGFAFRNRFATNTRAPSPQLGRKTSENSTSSVRSTSTGRPSLTRPPTPTSTLSPMPSNRSRPPAPIITTATPLDNDTNRFGSHPSMKYTNVLQQDDKRDTFSLYDKIDQLEEEKDDLVNRLRAVEDKWKEADARTKELEKQVASLGEGISLEERLLRRQEAALKQREAAFRTARQTKDARDDEIAALRLEVEAASGEAASATEQARSAESEARSLRTMTHRMILTQEEMEEVVLKRCWLARYWGLCVQYGIHADIAGPKHEYWLSLAPLPLEVVLSASQKAREEPYRDEQNGFNPEKKGKSARDLHDVSAEGNIENMLSVEKGLRELASLKVEDAVMLAMAQQRRPSPIRVGQAFLENTSLKGIDSARLAESFDLSRDEIEDAQFKQAWLVYFWRRAKNSGVEEDIADERLQHWISRSSQSPTFQDAVDVDRGLVDLRRLGIENQLWEASRKEIQEASLQAAAGTDGEAYPSQA